MNKILIIDDEIEMLESIEHFLHRHTDYETKFVNSPTVALDLVSKEKFDLIITDLKMEKVSGIEILERSLQKSPSTPVILITGYGTIEKSVEAMRMGAFDFIAKPFTFQKLLDTINRALHEKKKQDDAVEDNSEKTSELLGLVYKSKKMNELINYVKKVSPGDMNILITGESGTGKELIARIIHHFSRSDASPFVPVNCSALPEHLFESELFGHERGAFTGAIKTKPGLLEFANEGTFFLDEIGDLSMATQAKLLRMLEEKKIRRVGGQKEFSIDVRIIGATNKDLQKLVADGKFREDLFYRLTTIRIDIPPLRERTEDILPIAFNFISQNLCKQSYRVQKFSSEAENVLLSYSWPGNIRELQNVLSRAYYLCSDKIINKEDLPISSSDAELKKHSALLNLSYKQAKEESTERFEVEYFSYHLKQNKGNISKTAESCKLDRRTLQRLINKYKIIYKDKA